VTPCIYILIDFLHNILLTNENAVPGFGVPGEADVLRGSVCPGFGVPGEADVLRVFDVEGISCACFSLVTASCGSPYNDTVVEPKS